MIPTGGDVPEFQRNGLGLWVPASLGHGQQSEAPSVRYLEDVGVVALGYSDLFGQHSTVEMIVDRLRPYSMEYIIATVARVEAALNASSGRHGDLGERQRELATRLFPQRQKAVAEAVVSALGADAKPIALFFTQQLLNLVKIALLALPVSESHDEEPPPDDLAEALLMVSDLIALGPIDHLSSDERRRRLELFLFANAMFNHSPNLIHDLARGHDFFLQSHPRLVLPEHIDLREWARELTGLDPDAVWYALASFFMWYFSRDMQAVDRADVWIHRDRLFRNMPGLAQEDREKFFGLATIDIVDLQTQVRSAGYSLEDLRPFDVLAFAKTPMVRFGYRVYALSIQLAQQLAGTGLQYRFLNPATVEPRKRAQFLNMRGRLVEDEVDQLLSRTFGDRHVGSAEILKRAAGRKSCDDLIWSGDSLVLVECKAKLVHHDARTGTDWERLLALLKETYVDAADQLLSTIRMVKSGDFQDVGINPQFIRKYYPLVLTFELSMSPITYDVLLNEGFREHAIHIEPQVAPLVNIELEELELVELAIGYGESLTGLIEDKLDSATGPGTPFSHYWAAKGKRFIGPREHNPYWARRYQELTRDMMAYFRDHRLGGEGEPRLDNPMQSA